MKEISEDIINSVRELTKYNIHNQARFYCSQLVDPKLEKAYQSLIDLHDYFGEMSGGLIETRTNLDKILKTQLFANYSNAYELWSAL